MQLIPLENEAQLNEIASAKNYKVILKHNTTCPISKGVVERLQEEKATIEGVDGIYILDLLSNRELSNAIEGRFGVPHQSPQALLVKDGQCTYHEWGFDISADAIRSAVGKE
jgi:bacillithiol system protein YtxJ